MSLFSKPKVVLWPRVSGVEIFLNQKENNHFSFDLNLWQAKTETDLSPLLSFFKSNKISQVHLLLPDDVVTTRSFIYDSVISTIDSKEVLDLAQGFVDFPLTPEAIKFELLPKETKTVIRSEIFDLKQINLLKANLDKLGITASDTDTVSTSLARALSRFNQSEYYFIYPTGEAESILILAQKAKVFLSTVLKGQSVEIQKIINYSRLYFQTPVDKIYLPANSSLEVNFTAQLSKTPYNQEQISQELGFAANIPLAVIGCFVSEKSNPVIIKPTKIHMENQKKNILPIVAVFIFTTALASIIIFLVLNNQKEDSTAEVTPTPVVSSAPTAMPTATPMPTVTEISKKLKIQVLNATDINGQAATLKTILTKLGFTNISVGNATEKVDGNQIQLKEANTDAGNYFKTKLTGQFDAAISTDLKASSTYDAVFIIGTDISSTSSGTKTTPPPAE